MNAITAAAFGSISPSCLLPGCGGYGHIDGVCETELDSMPVVVGDLTITANAGDDSPVELAVWNDSGDLLRTCDPAEARAFADRIRAFAAAIDKGAALLAPPVPAPEPVDYAARFAALDVDTLFGMEDQGDCDNVDRYIESLLIVLAEWRPRVVAMLADAPEWAVPEAAAYRRALDRTREAYLQWSFRWEGGPVLPDTFDLPTEDIRPVVAPVARIASAGRRDLVVQGVAA